MLIGDKMSVCHATNLICQTEVESETNKFHGLKTLSFVSNLFLKLYTYFLSNSPKHSGVARGGQGGASAPGRICPRAPPGGGRQNAGKEFF